MDVVGAGTVHTRAEIPDGYRRPMSDTPARRGFRPATIAPLDDGFVVVDELQPVAMFVDGRGRCSEPVSWRHLPPATEWHWPPRSLYRDGSGVRIHERPDGPTVRLDRTPTGLRVDTPSGSSDGPHLATQRLAWPGRRATTTDGRTVLYETSHGSGWEAWVTLDEGSADAVVLALGPGSVTCSAEATDGAAAACVRRAQKRPWDFHPAFDLVVVPPGESAAVTVRGGDIDITDLCWPRPPVDVPTVLADYLPIVLADCRAAREVGADDVRFTVRELDRGPMIDIEFRRGSTPYIRTDEPLDELGRPCGLRAWAIFLEEDLLFDKTRPGPDGVVRF